MIGGHGSGSTLVYSYKSENGGKWVLEPYTMAEGEGYHVAMRVKPSILNNHCNVSIPFMKLLEASHFTYSSRWIQNCEDGDLMQPNKVTGRV